MSVTKAREIMSVHFRTMKKEMELVEKGEMDDQLLDMAKASER